MKEKKITMPAIALRGLTILPQVTINFDIVRSQSIAAVEEAMVGDQKVFLVTQIKSDEMEPTIADVYHIGTIGFVKQLVKMPGGMVRVTVEGMDRAELLDMETDGDFFLAEVTVLELSEDDCNAVEKEAMSRIVKEKLEEYGRMNASAAKEFLPNVLSAPSLEELLKLIAAEFPWNYTSRQQILECNTVTELYEMILKLLLSELEIYRVQKEFRIKVKAAVDKNQKEYILREQMRVIRAELGDDNPVSDADEWKKQLKSLKADKEIKDRILKEINRFQAMPAGSQDANVLRTYVETVLELPWNKVSKDNNDIKHAEKVLNEDHYGLEQVKERILEYLAVRILTKKGTSPIICLVGPPGTGKTSIARSVARALDKKYIRISLGGVHDEAEIRGHRKTYVGAMPGR
ncbi:MAG: LON peptidase substrate-binding domain-containing protein, partial [Clostridium sp.]